MKHEDVYLRGYANMAELTVGLAQYFAFYNAARPHQSLGYRTPASVYRSGTGGGALIADKYGSAHALEPEAATRGEGSPAARKRNTGQRRPAAATENDTA